MTTKGMLDKARKCREKGFAGHTDRYDTDPQYRTNCDGENIPRELWLPVNEENPIPLNADAYLQRDKKKAKAKPKVKPFPKKQERERVHL